MADTPPTRDWHKTVHERLARDPAFALAVAEEQEEEIKRLRAEIESLKRLTYRATDGEVKITTEPQAVSADNLARTFLCGSATAGKHVVPHIPSNDLIEDFALLIDANPTAQWAAEIAYNLKRLRDSLEDGDEYVPLLNDAYALLREMTGEFAGVPNDEDEALDDAILSLWEPTSEPL